MYDQNLIMQTGERDKMMSLAQITLERRWSHSDFLSFAVWTKVKKKLQTLKHSRTNPDTIRRDFIANRKNIPGRLPEKSRR